MNWARLKAEDVANQSNVNWYLKKPFMTVKWLLEIKKLGNFRA
jgi:hypothetical protein